MKQRAFLKLDGIAGTSKEPSHAGELEICKIHFSWDAKSLNPKLQLEFIKKLDSTSSTLLFMVREGEKIQKALLTIEKVEKDKSTRYYRVEMGNVVVSSFMPGVLNYPVKDGDGPSEPAEVNQITIDQIRLDIGNLIYPNVMATIGTDILSLFGLTVS